MKLCPHCKNHNPDSASFCGKCGFDISREPVVSEQQVSSGNQQQSNCSQNNDSGFVGKINSYLGNTNPANLNWRVLFSDIFKKHTPEEAEEIFIVGTSKTTPNPCEVSNNWPHPWLYSRVFLVFLGAFFLLWIGFSQFGNYNALPGAIVIGSFVVPIATLIMFQELNVWRNVSLLKVVKVFMIGGCASIIASLFLFLFVDIDQELTYGAALTVGIVEELGKAVIVFFFIKSLKSRNVLNSLLIGAGVGAGFAAFESAGYALKPVLVFMQYVGYYNANGMDLSPAEMIDAINSVILIRGILSPGGHVAWAAITGAAFSLASKNRNCSFSMFFDGQFLKLFVIPVALHTLWDCPLLSEGDLTFIKYILLTVLAWIVLLILVNMGLAEVENRESTAQV